jgi:hypothetical protein
MVVAAALGAKETISMEAQNYANHRRFSPAFHGVLFGLILLTLVGSIVNLYESLSDHQRLYSAALIVVVAFCLLMLALFSRVFALRAQDRASVRKRTYATLR